VEIGLYLLLLLISLLAVGLNLLSLPGNWIMLVGATLLSYHHGWNRPMISVLGLLLAILLAGECVEILGSLVGAKTFGATRAATWAALGGAVLGGLLGFLIPIPLIGNLVGGIAGAFLAAWGAELLQHRPLKLATIAALGAALGRSAGLAAKICCGLLAWLILLVFAFPK
jgi:uncharacterized protein